MTEQMITLADGTEIWIPPQPRAAVWTWLACEHNARIAEEARTNKLASALRHVAQQALHWSDHTKYRFYPKAAADADRQRICGDTVCSILEEHGFDVEKLSSTKDEAMTGMTAECPKCRGERWVANTADQEPWSAWQDLPPGSNISILYGLVRKIPCPLCNPEAPDADPE